MIFCRYIHEEWLLGDTLCRLYPVLFYGNVGVSLMNMVAITLNRYNSNIGLIIHYQKFYLQPNQNFINGFLHNFYLLSKS